MLPRAWRLHNWRCCLFITAHRCLTMPVPRRAKPATTGSKRSSSSGLPRTSRSCSDLLPMCASQGPNTSRSRIATAQRQARVRRGLNVCFLPDSLDGSLLQRRSAVRPSRRRRPDQRARPIADIRTRRSWWPVHPVSCRPIAYEFAIGGLLLYLSLPL